MYRAAGRPVPQELDITCQTFSLLANLLNPAA